MSAQAPSSASPMARSDGDAASPRDPAWMELVREYRFEAAHQLPRVPPGHRCARLHGHSYRVEVTVSGDMADDSGWVVDFYDMDHVVAPIVEALDHRFLNELPGLENPTSERLCLHLWRAIAPKLPGLSAITVWETHDSRCTYRGPANAAR